MRKARNCIIGNLADFNYQRTNDPLVAANLVIRREIEIASDPTLLTGKLTEYRAKIIRKIEQNLGTSVLPPILAILEQENHPNTLSLMDYSR